MIAHPLKARRAFVSPKVLAVILVVAVLVAMLGLAWYTLDQARAIKPQTKVASSKSDLTPTERRYLDALARRVQLPPTDSWSDRRLLDLAIRLNSELNARTPLNLDPARTPWLLPFPITRSSADLPNPTAIPIDLASGKIDLPAETAFYQYSITNTGSTPRPMPILYQDLRWDDAEALVATARLREIPDELDRAVAIWRLVASHRYHADPPTEGPEEHDLIKFLSCHGYGFCDDSAQAVAALAQLCKMQVRLVGLTGHVVPEIFAAGKWRMFDSDFAVYFHAPNSPREILGLDQLSQSRTAFAHPVALGPGGPYDAGYAEPFLSTNDNGPWPIAATTTHRTAHQLAPGERIVFTNYNWGRHFLGASPQRVPRYYNGYFVLPLPKVDAKSPNAGLMSNGVGNAGAQPAQVSFDFDSPFPIVGGRMEFGTGLFQSIAFEDLTPPLSSSSSKVTPLPSESRNGYTTWSLDSAIALIGDTPTYRFRLHFTIPPGMNWATLDDAQRMTIRIDFQFAEFPLLKLKPGPNAFQIHGDPKDLQAELQRSPKPRN